MRRALRVTALVGSVAALLVAVAAAGLLATGPGHALVRRWAVHTLGGVVDGHVRVGELSGRLWRTATVRDVELTLPDGSRVLAARRITVRYALGDLLRGRVVLRDVEIVGPAARLAQDSTGAWNVLRLFRLVGPDTAPPGRRPHIELRDVRIEEGTLSVRTRDESDAPSYAATGLRLELTRLRASHPDSSGVVAVVRRLALRLAEPSLVLEDLAGTVALDGDSLAVALERMRLPGSRLAAAGHLTWHDGLAGRFELTTSPLAFADVRSVASRLPRDGRAQLSATVRLAPRGVVSAQVRALELISGRSLVRGAGALERSASGAVRLRGARLDLAPLDLALLAPFVDSLPAQGLVRGQVAAAGSAADLVVRAQLTFTDEAVHPVVVSALAGDGRVGWSATGGPRVAGFTLRRVSLGLATAHRFVPALPDSGRLEATGRLDLTRDSAAFSGTLAHLVPGAAPTRLSGTARADFTASTVVAVDFQADSLSFDALARVVPGAPLSGAAAGRVALAGPLDALAYEVDLAGEWGRATGAGTVWRRDSVLAVAGAGGFERLNLRRHLPTAPSSRMSGEWRVSLEAPSGQADRGLSARATVALAPSLVEGVPMRGAAALEFGRERVLLDSLRLEVPGGSLRASGALGFPGAPIGQVTVVATFDTLASLVPLLRYGMRAGGDSGAVGLDGRGRFTGRLVGTLTDWDAEGTLALTRVEAAGFAVRTAEVIGYGARAGPDVVVRVEVAADSMAAFGVRYAPVQLEVTGLVDSLTVSLSAGFGEGSALRTGLAVWRDSVATRARLRDLELDLPLGDWRLVAPADLAVLEAGIALDSLELRAHRGAGRLRAGGMLPRAESGHFALEADSVPLASLVALLGRDTTGIGGAVALRARLEGPAANPAMGFEVFLSDGRFGEYRAPEVQVLGTYASRRLNLKGGLWRGERRIVSLSGALPLDLALTGVSRRRLPEDLALVVRADTLDLALVGFVTEAVREPTGRAALDLRLGGSWDDPQVSGFVETFGAAMTLPALGVRYRELDARLELEGDAIRVARAVVRSGDGTLEVGGSVRLPSLSRPALDLTARLARFHAMERRDLAGVVGTGEVTLRGPGIGATLEGRLTVDEGYLRFADLVEKRVVNLDDPEFRAIVDSTLARAHGLGPGLPTVFLDSLRIRNLTVALGPDVWLRSSEANIQLAGEFVVAKEVEAGLPRYRMDGTLRAVRGSYRLVFQNALSREFRVSRGTVRFYGTPDFNPELDIVAEHQVRRVEGGALAVRAVIGGTLQAPRLRLESDERPPLSETELVSYLMFGRPVAQLTQRTGSRSDFDPLRDPLVMLTGELGQALVGGIGLPLDVLTIRPGQGADALAGATVEAGVQVGSRTFVSLNAGLCEVRTTQLVGVSIEYRLSAQWATEASVEPVVRECRAGGGTVTTGTARYQMGLDLFWTIGGLR